jgi:hypothetical protein
LDRYFSTKEVCPATDIGKAEAFFPDLFRIESFSVVGHVEFNPAGRLVQGKVNQQVTGAGMPEDVIDLFLNDPEDHQFRLIAKSFKVSDGPEVDLDSPGDLYALYQVDQRVHEAEITDTGRDEGPGDIPDLADGMVNIAGTAVNKAQPLLVIALGQFQV